MNISETGEVSFDKDVALVGRVLRVVSRPHNDKGAEQLSALVVLEHPTTGEETAETWASCAAWTGFLHPSLTAMADTPEQRYAGFYLATTEGKRGGGVFHNVVALEGVRPPADWKDTMRALGLLREAPPSNGKAPAAMPGAKSASALDE